MRRPIIFVLLAGFAALVAALVVYSALKKREREVQQAMAQTVEIVVASHNLTIGTRLDAKSVKLTRWSRDSIPPGSFTNLASVMGQYTKTSFVQNEPIVADRLFKGVKNAGVLPLLIPVGMRAISLPVDEVSDIAGFVLPRSHVDVLISTTNGGQQFSKIVLEDVEVLAVAQEVEQVNDKPKVVHVVTFLVTPNQAERLTLASREGVLRLAMRNYNDNKIVDTTGVNVHQLLAAYGGAQPSVPLMAPQHIASAPRRYVPPKPKPVRVEIMRNGTSTESISFVKTGGSTRQMRQPPPPRPSTSRADNGKKVAAAGSATMTPTVKTSGSSRGLGIVAGGMPATGLVPAGSARTDGARLSADGSSSGPAPFSGPRAKTINIP